MTDVYADIRPFNDDEVAEVLQRLLASDSLISALYQHKFPSLPAFIQGLLKPVFYSRIRKEIASVHSVTDFQLWLEPKVEQLLKQTTTTIEVCGLERLEAAVPYLWISNHRDIAMDPTVVNFSLHRAGWPTSRIAIGDNLLNNPDIADIMRLNKSFIVKRSVVNKRQKLRELQRLSAYIRYSLEQQQSIWIAQREGRAKDAIDRTDTAVIKMLALHGRERGETFTQTMQALSPLPVSIQYEWDPCDRFKAQELVDRAHYGEYLKDQDEDVRSILTGLLGNKGKVKVVFGRPLHTAEMADADTMARCIDQQLTEMHEIWPVHRAALHILQQDFSCYSDLPDQSNEQGINPKKSELQQRIAGLNKNVQQRLLQNYAAPFMTG